MATAEQVRQAVEAYVAAYQANDKAKLLDAFAPDGVMHDPVGTPPHVGRDAIGAFWDSAHSLADELKFDVRDVVVCGSEAVMVFQIRAQIGDGGMLIDAVDVFEVGDDGKITQVKAFFDLEQATPIS
jgi:steroid delta-isomerase